jgi:putative transposase
MSKDTEKAVVGLSGAGLGLDELVRQGARQVIQQAIEAELAELLERSPANEAQGSLKRPS